MTLRDYSAFGNAWQVVKSVEQKLKKEAPLKEARGTDGDVDPASIPVPEAVLSGRSTSGKVQVRNFATSRVKVAASPLRLGLFPWCTESPLSIFSAVFFARALPNLPSDGTGLASGARSPNGHPD